MDTRPTEPRKRPSAKAASVAPGAAERTTSAKAAKPAKAAKLAKVAKLAKPAPEVSHKREKLVRDSFALPKGEYEALAGLKQRAYGLAVPAKKSELLRAGVKALAAMDDAALLAALRNVPAIKTGRPAAEARAQPASQDAGAEPH